MALIGNPIVSTDFPVDYASGNGSTTAFTLSIAPASVNAVDVEVSGVSQSPQTYTISGTTLTFSAAPPSGTNNIVFKHRGVAGIPNTPAAGSVVTSSIADNAITAAKMGANGTWAPAGTVLQVVQATSVAQLNTTSTSYVTTALTASITPKFSTSKIIVNVNGNLYGNMIATIYRNGSDICSTAQGFMSASTSQISTIGYSYIDSPATTSSTTYTVYIKAVTGSPWWNINSSVCPIILTEIAG